MAAPPGGGGDGASSTAANGVCCMCGDHGQPHELFRCNGCRLRTQHRYCSDLYPRAEGPYRSCNWCLREGGAGAAAVSPVEAPTAAAATKRRLNDDYSRGDDGRDKETDCGGCSRSAFSAGPGKPIKKPKKQGRERAAQQPPVVVAAAAAAAKKRREVPEPGAGGRKQQARFRVKVRRYKLLAEVIC